MIAVSQQELQFTHFTDSQTLHPNASLARRQVLLPAQRQRCSHCGRHLVGHGRGQDAVRASQPTLTLSLACADTGGRRGTPASLQATDPLL